VYLIILSWELNGRTERQVKALAITLSSQIAELYDIPEGDYVEFTPIGTGEFRIKKGSIYKFGA